MSKRFSEKHAAEARLQALRAAASRGEDFWARQIDQLEPEHEQVLFEYSKNVMVSVARSAAISDAARVESLFRSFGAAAFLTRRDDVMILEIYPARPARATDEQRKIARRTLDGTTEAFADYLVAARRLYSYLDEHPDRAEPVLAVLFDTSTDIGEDEEPLVRALRERMEKIMEIFGLHETQPYTLDELSRLVFNPFPAETSIEISGVAEEVVGFESTSPARYQIPNMGIWGAIQSLEGKWVSPDPLIADFKLKGEEKKNRESIVRQFAMTQRTYSETPRGAEILREIERRLTPAAVYRIRWRLPEKAAVTE